MLEQTRARKLVAFLAALALVLGMLSGCGLPEGQHDSESAEAEETAVEYERPEKVKSGAEALKLLKEGNERFTSGELANKDVSAERREELRSGQEPFAVVVTCSDSRVPPEVLFDQGLGDIFIIRVAGNVIDPVAMGSIEYGVEHLESPLVVVMGHESCGAVKATIAGGKAEGSIGAIVQRIAPAVAKARTLGVNKGQIVEEAIDENIVMQLDAVRKSPVVAEKMKDGELEVVGAKYHLSSGDVEWLE